VSRVYRILGMRSQPKVGFRILTFTAHSIPERRLILMVLLASRAVLRRSSSLLVVRASPLCIAARVPNPGLWFSRPVADVHVVKPERPKSFSGGEEDDCGCGDSCGDGCLDRCRAALSCLPAAR
jgi:hypothetical protein